MKLVKKICLMLIVLGLISGCTTNPYTGQKQVSRTAIGVGAGAAGGALVGQLIGGNTTGTLIGAGVGAVAGGLVGGYMDKQAADLRKQLQGTGVSVVKNGSDIKLIMPGDITFATNSSDIKPQFYNTLNSVAIVLKKYNKTVVTVAGYTDNTGTTNYNQQLSERRAQSVASYLTSQGVNGNRFSVVGYGERNPVASNSNPQGRALNRRVEISIHEIK
ncbi:MAG: OmpA family protein [Coxiellaceae bacterium]|nr:MAG: OmpA family protein [Coxiellaceae bacterium]